MALRPIPPRSPILDQRTQGLSREWMRYFSDLFAHLDELSNDVTSVYARTGAVVAAASDYDASQVDNDSDVTGAFVDDALNTLDGETTSLDTRLTAAETSLSAINVRLTAEEAKVTALQADQPWQIKTSAYTAAAFDRILADTATTAAWVLKMPGSPTTGDEVFFMDATGNWNTANLTANGNGKNIMGSGTRVYSTDADSASLIYNGTEWRERT